jgi:WD40 repeat protein
VFISYSRKDDAAVATLVQQLHAAGLVPWFDRWSLTPGRRWKHEIAEGLMASASCAVFVGPESVGDWEREEVDVALDVAAHDADFRLFLVLLPGVPNPFDPSRLSPFLNSRTWVDFRGGIHATSSLQALLNAVKGVPIGPDVAAPPTPGQPPYVGLRSFEEDDSAFFFGRDAAIQRLLERLKESRFLAILGGSGSGKSSLVRAGLLPALRRGALPGSERWTVSIMTPRAHPLDTLAASVVRQYPGEGMHRTVDDLGSDARTLHHASMLALADRPDGHRAIWVVDQAEEVFTLARDERERERFLANLAYAGSVPGGRSIVVLTLRADFYPRFAGYPEIAQVFGQNQVLIGPMDQDELREIIERPARASELQLEAGLTATILDDVAQQPGALPLLSHTLLELWARRRGRLLTVEAYQETGGVAGAVAQRADEVFGGFSASEQDTARQVLLRLTQPGDGTEDTRRRALFSELATAGDPAAVAHVVAELADARLLTTSSAGQTDDRYVEVAHEALIRGWPRLRAWIEEDRVGLRVHRRLTESAQEWERLGHDEGLLYRTNRLVEALEWRDRLALNATEVAFIEASARGHEQALREAEARRQRELDQAQRLARARGRARGWLLAAVAVLIIGVVGLGLALSSARRQRDEAQLQKRQADSRRLAATALSKRSAAPELGLLLAVAGGDVMLNDETLDALRGTLSGWPLRAKLELPRAPRAIGFSPDGRTVVATTRDGVGLYRADTGAQRRWVELPNAFTTTLDPSGRLALTHGRGWARLWTAANGATRGEVRGPLLAAAFSGRRALALLRSGSSGVVVRDVASGRTVARLPRVHDLGADGGAVSPDGRTILTWSFQEARLWDLRSKQQRGPTLRAPHYMKTGFFSPDGRYVALIDDRVRLWRTSPVTSAGVIKGRVNVGIAAFSRDEHYLAASSFQRVDVLDLRRRRLLHRLPVEASAIAFSADGDSVLFAVPSEGPQVWDIIPGRLQRRLPSPGGIAALDLAADGRSAVVAGTDGRSALWGTTAEAPSIALRAGGETWRSAYFSQDGRFAVVGNDDGTVTVWSGKDGGRLARLDAADAGVTAAFDDDGRRVVALSARDDATVWDWQRRRLLGSLPRVGAMSYFDVSPHGTRLLVGDKSGGVVIWDLRSRKKVASLSGHRHEVLFAEFTSDGQSVVTVAAGERPRVWRATTGELVGFLGASDDPAYGGGISADGRRTVIVGANGLRIWDTRSREPVTDLLRVPTYSTNLPKLSRDGRVLVAFDGVRQGWLWNVDERAPARQDLPETKSATVSGDGRYAFTSTPAGVVNVWDTRNGRLATTLRGRISPGSTLEANLDGTRILVEDHGGIRLVTCELCLDQARLLELARARVTRGLTETERARYLR